MDHLLKEYKLKLKIKCQMISTWEVIAVGWERDDREPRETKLCQGHSLIWREDINTY